MGCRILTVGVAIVWVALWADRAIGASPADVDQIVGVAARYATDETHPWGAALLPANLSGSFDQTHILEDDEIRINRFVDVPVAPEAHERPIDIEVAQARSAAGDVKLLVRTDFLPFIDPSHPEGGVLVGMVRRALEYAGYDSLLDLSGWEADGTHFRRVNVPYPHDRSKDAEYLFSAPIMNVEVRAYRHHDSKFSVGSVADLAGRRVCASQAFLAQTAHALGSSSDIDLIEGDLVSCFQGLLDGEHDIVLAEWGIGEFYVNELAIEPLLTAGDDVIDLGSLYAVMPKFSPYSTVMMYDLNEALTNMRQSGELEELLKADERRRSAFVHDNPISPSELSSPLETENPTADDSGAPKGATM